MKTTYTVNGKSFKSKREAKKRMKELGLLNIKVKSNKVTLRGCGLSIDVC